MTEKKCSLLQDEYFVTFWESNWLVPDWSGMRPSVCLNCRRVNLPFRVRRSLSAVIGASAAAILRCSCAPTINPHSWTSADNAQIAYNFTFSQTVRRRAQCDEHNSTSSVLPYYLLQDQALFNEIFLLHSLSNRILHRGTIVMLQSSN